MKCSYIISDFPSGVVGINGVVNHQQKVTKNEGHGNVTLNCSMCHIPARPRSIYRTHSFCSRDKKTKTLSAMHFYVSIIRITEKFKTIISKALKDLMISGTGVMNPDHHVRAGVP